MTSESLEVQLAHIREQAQIETDEEGWARYEAEHDTSSPDIEAAILRYYPYRKSKNQQRETGGKSLRWIAETLNITPESVRKTAKRMEKQGLIKLRDRGEIQANYWATHREVGKGGKHVQAARRRKWAREYQRRKREAAKGAVNNG